MHNRIKYIFCKKEIYNSSNFLCTKQLPEFSLSANKLYIKCTNPYVYCCQRHSIKRVNIIATVQSCTGNTSDWVLHKGNPFCSLPRSSDTQPLYFLLKSLRTLAVLYRSCGRADPVCKDMFSSHRLPIEVALKLAPERWHHWLMCLRLRCIVMRT